MHPKSFQPHDIAYTEDILSKNILFNEVRLGKVICKGAKFNRMSAKLNKHSTESEER